MTAALKSESALYEMFEPMLCEWDRAQWKTPGHAQAMLDDMSEALRAGAWGCAWDNVAWIGTWDVDPTTLRCPVLLWYGSEDRMASPAHAGWFEENLPTSTLTMWEGEGHLLAFAHLGEICSELLAAHP
jgi:pimeloyl-ACP methyl ester carboxylesterase